MNPAEKTKAEMFPNIIDRVYDHQRLGSTVPPGKHFNAERVAFYTGMQLEELAEKLRAVAEGHVVENDRMELRGLAHFMDTFGKQFKEGKHYGAVLRADREELLDGDIDSMVVSIASMVYSTPKHLGAVDTVMNALEAKEWPDSTFHHDENGKMIKPPGWSAPDLSPFVDRTGQSLDDDVYD